MLNVFVVAITLPSIPAFFLPSGRTFTLHAYDARCQEHVNQFMWMHDLYEFIRHAEIVRNVVKYYSRKYKFRLRCPLHSLAQQKEKSGLFGRHISSLLLLL